MSLVGAVSPVGRRGGNQESRPHHPTFNSAVQNQGHDNTFNVPDIRRENPFTDLPDQLPIINNLPQLVLNNDEIFIWGPDFTQGGQKVLQDMMYSGWFRLQKPRYDAISKLEQVMEIVFTDPKFPLNEQTWVMTALSNLYDRGLSGSLAFDEFGFKPDKQFFRELHVRKGHEIRATVLLKSIGILPNLSFQSEWARNNFELKGDGME